ncbi:LLM class flavin-dependent oxidoreductase [Rhodococcus sp. IEGM 1379]|uniref:LLM class flavin-dependent oxidoreductase n=1 Tax=Rhodococcus sp. IEGM 1379 TaxID=3047086 RepID=UPI0024B6A0D4|nr:LLM class flavin-dependent oxidoreductase [Rhodococcus sp. IEGM 1379]MDI9918144.1 LLM class flavin-dependent oxidoreductase [Rhodococcus sp. IEGM 1379]
MNERDYGIFLPISNGGWIVSDTAPKIEATYDYNREVAVAADQLGFDFIMSQAKWRGYGGRTDHWGRTLESMTMMAGLAEATERVKIWSTVHTILFNPAIIAKMFTTLDQISAGRCGMNIVVGSFSQEFAQMGMWPEELDHASRYRYSEEWTRILLDLWSKDEVTHHGEFFDLDQCSSRPHPAVTPTLISAGRSPAGLAFQGKYCDASFLSAHDLTGLRQVSREAKDAATEHGRSLKTYAMATVVLGDTDADADRRYELYGAGADQEALQNMAIAYGMPVDKNAAPGAKAQEQSGFQTEVIKGSAETVTSKIEEMVEYAKLDGLMLIFPDYVPDMTAFAAAVLPSLSAVSA